MDRSLRAGGRCDELPAPKGPVCVSALVASYPRLITDRVRVPRACRPYGLTAGARAVRQAPRRHGQELGASRKNSWNTMLKPR